MKNEFRLNQNSFVRAERVIFILMFLVLGCSNSPEVARLQSLAAAVPEGIECSGENHKSIFEVMIEQNQKQELQRSKDDAPNSSIQNSMARSDVIKNLQFSITQRVNNKSKSSNQDKKQELIDVTVELIALLENDIQNFDQDDYETKIARIDYGSKITEDYEKASKRTRELLTRAQELSKDLEINCDYKPTGYEQSPSPQPQTKNRSETETATEIATVQTDSPLFPTTMLAGLRWTMSTAYQSCEALKLPPVTTKTESTQGIRRMSDKGREYENLEMILKTHYYWKNLKPSAGCVDMRAQPLVYDYGGAARIKSEKLDMFSNYNGGKALGIDCSAFASTAAATAGLLYVKNSKKRPIYSRWTTRDFVNPESSGWSCYSKVKVGPKLQLQAGDLAVLSADHMVGIDSLDADPLGIDSVTDIKQCDNLNSDDFHFTLIQSAATKGSLGINRFVAADYLKETDNLRALFIAYAKASCIAKFTGRDLVPQIPSSMSIVRHAGTSECMAARVPLTNELCIQRCTN